MWSAKSDAVWVYLSGSTVALGGPGVEPRHLALTSETDWRDTLSQWVTELPRRAWRMALGGRCCTLHRIEPILGTRSIEEAEEAVAATLSSEGASLQARLATWSPRGSTPWLAVCMPSGLPEELTVLMEANGRLQTLTPWWRLVPAQAAVDMASAAMCDDECVTYWRSDARGVITSAGSLLTTPQSQPLAMQRLRATGALNCWDLGIENWGSDAAFRCVPGEGHAA